MYSITGSRLFEDAGRPHELVQLGSEQVAGDHLPGHQHRGLGGELDIHLAVQPKQQLPFLTARNVLSIIQDYICKFVPG